MKLAMLVVVLLIGPASFAQSNSQPRSRVTGIEPQSGTVASQSESGTPTPQPVRKGCLAVKSVGSHAFRNIMLIGVAGALVSREQFQVVDAVEYPARIGQKFHGSDLQTISASGTRVAILEKHYSSDELHQSCH
jgi:hypothetical protein